MTTNWFQVDKGGLAAVLARRGPGFAVLELLANAWDSGASLVEVFAAPIQNSPYIELSVTDDSDEGWADLEHAFTMFAPSRRAGVAEKRGRFNLGEKLVLSLCRSAVITTTSGTLIFDEKGRRQTVSKRLRGTRFACEIRMTRDELADAVGLVKQCIPPVRTMLNGEEIGRPEPIATFTAKLPTEIADADGNLVRTVRTCTVEAYQAVQGDVLEMGVPVCSAPWPWRLNVLQKVPLNMERDSVTGAFMRALQVVATNALVSTLDGCSPEEFAAPWLSECLSDGRIAKPTVEAIVKGRFGERAVVAVPGDPIANAKAEAAGFTVVHGGAMGGEAWANVRKHGIMLSTSQAFPTPKPVDNSAQKQCPTCGQVVR